jgi:hypothetical protein
VRVGLRHRSRAQTISVAAVAMVAIVGGLAMVIDGGIFFVVQRQMQAAADAGALAGAWYDPVCPSVYTAQGCRLGAQAAPALNGTAIESPPDCQVPASAGTPNCAWCDGTTGIPSCDVALANAAAAKPLCGGQVRAFVSTGTQLNRPRNVNTIVVTVQCDAGYSFGRILGLSARRISASGAVGIGNRDCSGPGDMTDFDITQTPFCGFIARLIH